MKKRYEILTIILIVTIVALGCERSFLEVSPKGVMTEENLSGPAYIDGFVISAYAHICKRGAYETVDNWFFGDARSGNSYKGGSGLTDQTAYHEMTMFAPVTANVGNNTSFWNGAYASISRINAAIKQLNKVTVEEYPQKNARLGEMKFLRAFCHFGLKERYKWIPYVTEDMTTQDIKDEPNHPADAQNDLFLWQKIYDDFDFAFQNLPPTQSEPGRPTKYTAEAYMVQTLLWMAYKQDETHQLVEIDLDILEDALTLCNDIINSSDRELTSDYAENFMYDFENNEESLFEIQYSINDGTSKGNLNYGVSLNTPTWQPYYRCCCFHKMSYDMVNAFRTDAEGLPFLDNYNSATLHNNYTAYFSGNTFDPRLSHTVAIPGHPWKYDPYLKYDSAGSRNPAVYGYMHSLKEQVHPFEAAQWENRQNSMNKRILRYSQVLLWKAEILIQLNREAEAVPLINEVRQRAANSTGRLKMADGSPILHYNVALYQPGVNCEWTNDFAWKALMFEDRIEFAGEGSRFFNLVRWGIAEEVINDFFAYEVNYRSWYSSALFTAGKHEYLPIPQDVINLSEGVYVQNINY
jgi:hypothetical protein